MEQPEEHTPATCGTGAAGTQCQAAISSVTNAMLPEMKTGFTVCESDKCSALCLCIHVCVKVEGVCCHMHTLHANAKCVSKFGANVQCV